MQQQFASTMNTATCLLRSCRSRPPIHAADLTNTAFRSLPRAFRRKESCNPCLFARSKMTSTKLSPEHADCERPSLRRWKKFPARIVALSDIEVLECQLIENGQRENVHPMEEAFAYKAMLQPKARITTLRESPPRSDAIRHTSQPDCA